MNRAERGGPCIAFFEILDVGRALLERPEIGHSAHRLRPQSTGTFELLGRPQPRGAAHEVAPDRQRVARAVRLPPDWPGLIESNPDADDYGRREADEPRVLEIVGGSGLPSGGKPDAPAARRRARAARHRILEHGHHLVGRLLREHPLGLRRVVEGRPAIGVHDAKDGPGSSCGRSENGRQRVILGCEQTASGASGMKDAERKVGLLLASGWGLTD